MLNFLLSNRQDTRAEQSGKYYPQINNTVSLCVVNGLLKHCHHDFLQREWKRKEEKERLLQSRKRHN